MERVRRALPTAAGITLFSQNSRRRAGQTVPIVSCSNGMSSLGEGAYWHAVCKPTGCVSIAALFQQHGRAGRLGVCTLATDAEGACVAVAADEEDKTWSQTVDFVAQRSGFHTPEALDFFVNKYCTVVSSADRRTVKRSDEQLQLLQVTCMVCAVRSNGNIVDGGAMGTALLQSFNQLSPKEVRPFSADPREIDWVHVLGLRVTVVHGSTARL